MPKKFDEYDLLLHRADDLCAQLARKRYVAVLGQAVRVYTPDPDWGGQQTPPGEDREPRRDNAGVAEATGLPITFFGPVEPPPATLYLTSANADDVDRHVAALPALGRPRLYVADGRGPTLN